MNSLIFQALLDTTRDFINEAPDEQRSQQLSLNARCALYHTYSIFIREYQHDITYAEIREITDAYIHVINCIHRKFNTEQVGSYLSHPR
jgi:hypothetical protein